MNNEQMVKLALPTLAERRAGRVTIEVKADGAMSVQVDGGQRMYSEEEVMKAQASEGELISKALRSELDQVHAKYQDELKKVRAEREEMHRQLNSQGNRLETVIRHREEAEAQLKKVRAERDRFRDQAYEQNDIAADLRGELNRVRADLNAARSHRDALQEVGARMSDRVTEALAALTSPAVEEAMENGITRRSLTLAQAIKSARQELNRVRA